MGCVFRLTKDMILPSAGQRVLKAADAALLLEARNILDAAEKRAEEIIHEAEQVYAQRHEQGYADGKAEGKMEHAEKLMETVMSSLEFIEGVETTVVDVVNQAVRKVIGELEDDERIVRIVRTALTTVRNQQHVTVRVAPSDAPAVSTALAALLQSAPGKTSFLDLVPDARLEPGSCLLESELGVVDAGLETQLKALENAFRARINA
jgi:type III secretion protein L